MVGHAAFRSGKRQPVAPQERRTHRQGGHLQPRTQVVAHMPVAGLQHVFVPRMLVPVTGIVVVLQTGQQPGIQQRLPDEQRAVRAAPLAPLQMPVGGPEP